MDDGGIGGCCGDWARGVIALGQNIYRIDKARCGDLEAARGIEWLVTNGRGGYAMASVTQTLTRRYHGLLVAAVEPPVERFVLLAKLEVTALIDGLTYELSTNDYTEAVHPQGYRLLESFSMQPYPTWRWRAGASVIEQTLCMGFGEDTTFIRYRLVEGDRPVQLSVRPLCTSRHFHVLTNYQDMGPPNVEHRDELLEFRWAAERPDWTLSHNGAFRPRPDWYYQFVLTADAQRGYDSTQDLFVPGVITATLDPVGQGSGLVFAASTQQRSWKAFDTAFAEAAARAKVPMIESAEEDVLVEPLLRATGDFLATRDDTYKTILAGFPWFSDWGRDTFISLPGLCLVPGRFAEARRIIQTFANYVDGGMIPNRFPDFREPPSYNTVDGTLWFIHAIGRYLAYTDDWSLIADELFPVICNILDSHEKGTRHGIRLAPDGLLAAGEHGFALTWMDAKLPDRAVTPRIGKPVEISALWYNALEIAASFADRLGDGKRADHWDMLAAKARTTFNARYWNGAAGCLYDVLDVDHAAGTVDAAIRPNQLIAMSLAYPILDTARWRSVVEVCRRDLLTPLGLRTLAPGSADYRPRYAGDLQARDVAYHQGTVWPWLLGPFVTAYVRAHGESPDAQRTARSFLVGLLPHLSDAGIGSISEVADADPPHTPGGCPWQAWSVAEPLRALCEDILRTHPARQKSAAAPIAPPRQPETPRATVA